MSENRPSRPPIADPPGERYVVEPGTLCGCCGLDGAECRCSWACALADSCTAQKEASSAPGDPDTSEEKR